VWIGLINYLKILKIPHSIIFLDSKGFAASLPHVAGIERFSAFVQLNKKNYKKSHFSVGGKYKKFLKLLPHCADNVKKL
jgi:hypothetical protein